MTPGQRIIIIQEIAKKLAKSSWPDIDLTLRQFELPWSESWVGADRYTYILQHIENETDIKLQNLYEYLVNQKAGQLNISQVAEPWHPKWFRLFISHIHTDKELVSNLKIELSKYGVDGFVAHEDIQPSAEWLPEIDKALGTCDGLMPVITNEFHKSLWVDQEVGFCIGRRILVIPLTIDLIPYGFMSQYQALKGKDKIPPDIAKNIFSILITHDLTKSKMTESLISRFEEAESFDDANRLARLLLDIPIWTPSYLRRIENAPKNNHQIADAWKAQEIIPQLLSSNSK